MLHLKTIGMVLAGVTLAGGGAFAAVRQVVAVKKPPARVPVAKVVVAKIPPPKKPPPPVRKPPPAPRAGREAGGCKAPAPKEAAAPRPQAGRPRPDAGPGCGEATDYGGTSPADRRAGAGRRSRPRAGGDPARGRAGRAAGR